MTGETLRSRLADGGTALGTMVFEFQTLGIPRIAASAGADFVLIDLEHTGWGVEGIRPLLAAGAARDVALLVRVQGSARHLISPSLDLGARGVMVPSVPNKNSRPNRMTIRLRPDQLSAGLNMNESLLPQTHQEEQQ